MLKLSYSVAQFAVAPLDFVGPDLASYDHPSQQQLGSSFANKAVGLAAAGEKVGPAAVIGGYKGAGLVDWHSSGASTEVAASSRVGPEVAFVWVEQRWQQVG